MTRFVIKIKNELRVIGVEEIYYFYIENKSTYIVTKDGRWMTHLSLDEIENIVNFEYFIRINRQVIINIKSLDKIVEWKSGKHATYKLVLKPTNKVVFTSNERTMKFKRWLGY